MLASTSLTLSVPWAAPLQLYICVIEAHAVASELTLTGRCLLSFCGSIDCNILETVYQLTAVPYEAEGTLLDRVGQQMCVRRAVGKT